MRRNPYPEHIDTALRRTPSPQDIPDTFNYVVVSPDGGIGVAKHNFLGNSDIGNAEEYLQLLLDLALRFEIAAELAGRAVDGRIDTVTIALPGPAENDVYVIETPRNRPSPNRLSFRLLPHLYDLRDPEQTDALLIKLVTGFVDADTPEAQQRVRDAVAATRPAATPGEPAAKPKRAKKQTQQRTPAQGEGVAAQPTRAQRPPRRRQPQSGSPMIPSGTPPTPSAQGGRQAQGGPVEPQGAQTPPPPPPSAPSPPDPSDIPHPNVVVFTCVEKNTSELTNLAARTFTNAQIAAVTDDVYNDIPGLTNPEKARAKEISETLRDFAGRVLADDYYTAGGAVFMFMPINGDLEAFAFIDVKTPLPAALADVAKSPRAKHVVVTTLPFEMLRRSEQSDVDAAMAIFAEALVELLDQTDLDFDLDAYDILGL